MSQSRNEATGRLHLACDGKWELNARNWKGPCRMPDGSDAYMFDERGCWLFCRRIDAVAFARRKGIRLQEEQ